MAEWQAMGSAPKDGTAVLLHFPGEIPDVRIGAWAHHQRVDGISGDVVFEQIGWAMSDRAEIRPEDDPAAWAPCAPPSQDDLARLAPSRAAARAG